MGGPMNRKTVDIVVPVFNAYEDVKLCIESLKETVDLSIDRIIILNDCSTDQAVTNYLQSIKSPRIDIIFNSENLGFTKTVNKGMKLYRSDDVILLNSDTIVTRGWVDKLVAAAYSRKNIATVTPLSNNAAICSVPVPNEYNRIPLGYNINDFARLVEDVSEKKYPEIPTAHGFCMYIKRQVLDDIGYFDESHFRRGYGEENDFSFRAILNGYNNIMCDDTFIFHKGTASFPKKEKLINIKEAEEFLRKKYPRQIEYLDYYISSKCNEEVSKRIKSEVCNYVIPYEYRKKIIVFGVGKLYHKNEEKIRSYFNVVGYLDNNKAGNTLNGLEVFSSACSIDKAYDYIVLMSLKENEMIEQLKTEGVDLNKVLDFNKYEMYLDDIHANYNRTNGMQKDEGV